MKKLEDLLNLPESRHIIDNESTTVEPEVEETIVRSHKELDKIWQILDVEKEVGISLTESRAMYPAASVSGWYFSHPKSMYFSVLNN